MVITRSSTGMLPSAANTPSNTMRVILEEASVVEEPLGGISTGVSGLFTRESDRRYRATVKMNVEFLSPDGIRLGGLPVRGERTHEALEGLTVNQREKLWTDMTEKLVQDINRAMSDALRTQLGSFIVQPVQQRPVMNSPLNSPASSPASSPGTNY